MLFLNDYMVELCEAPCVGPFLTYNYSHFKWLNRIDSKLNFFQCFLESVFSSYGFYVSIKSETKGHLDSMYEAYPFNIICFLQFRKQNPGECPLHRLFPTDVLIGFPMTF